jgi:hypothetical protein
MKGKTESATSQDKELDLSPDQFEGTWMCLHGH